MQATGETWVIDGRFAGPPGAANGGYVAGLLGGRLGGTAEVTLRRPVPLGVPLRVLAAPPGAAPALGLAGTGGDGAPLAEARPGRLSLEIPAAPSFAEALAASGRASARRHPFARCFVCGPERARGDGLRVFAGIVGGGRVAAAWVPDASLCDGEAVAPRFLWAALDCPGAAAASGEALRPMLLGRMTGVLERGLAPGDRCVALGFRLGGEGRKHLVGTALFDGVGRVVGRSLQVWIEPRPGGRLTAGAASV